MFKDDRRDTVVPASIPLNTLVSERTLSGIVADVPHRLTWPNILMLLGARPPYFPPRGLFSGSTRSLLLPKASVTSDFGGSASSSRSEYGGASSTRSTFGGSPTCPAFGGSGATTYGCSSSKSEAGGEQSDEEHGWKEEQASASSLRLGNGRVLVRLSLNPVLPASSRVLVIGGGSAPSRQLRRSEATVGFSRTRYRLRACSEWPQRSTPPPRGLADISVFAACGLAPVHDGRRRRGVFLGWRVPRPIPRPVRSRSPFSLTLHRVSFPILLLDGFCRGRRCPFTAGGAHARCRCALDPSPSSLVPFWGGPSHSARHSVVARCPAFSIFLAFADGRDDAPMILLV
ncbi:hypothetical protein C8J57DRAFT_1713564 [Mycena rebaudengoi]|nr:hypothetical protein C8J57DRAFT_1713564 [Mycena rebaudengoi]